MLHYCSKKGIGNFLSVILKYNKYDIDVRYVPVVETMEQEKAYDKAEEFIDTHKARVHNKLKSKSNILKCKDKLQKFRIIIVQENQAIIWMDGFNSVHHRHFNHVLFLHCLNYLHENVVICINEYVLWYIYVYLISRTHRLTCFFV